MTDLSRFACFFDEMDIKYSVVLLRNRLRQTEVPPGAKWTLEVSGQNFYFDDTERFVYSNDGKRVQCKDQRLSEEAIAKSALCKSE